MAWDLGFSITGDNSPLRRKVDELGPHMEKAGRKISERFKVGWEHGVAGLFITSGVAVGRAAAEAMADAKKAISESAKLGVSISEWQQIAVLVEQTGQSAETFAKALKLGGQGAAELRKQMAVSARVDGPQAGNYETKNLSLASGVLSTAWQTFKRGVGVGTAAITDVANATIHGVGGAVAGYQTLMRTGSISAAYESASDVIARGDTSALRDATRQKEAALVAKRAAARVKEDEEARKAAEAAAKKTSSGSDPYAFLKPGQATVDALSSVGIGTAATQREQSQFQDKAAEYLRRIAENTADNGLGDITP